MKIRRFFTEILTYSPFQFVTDLNNVREKNSKIAGYRIAEVIQRGQELVDWRVDLGELMSHDCCAGYLGVRDSRVLIAIHRERRPDTEETFYYFNITNAPAKTRKNIRMTKERPNKTISKKEWAEKWCFLNTLFEKTRINSYKPLNPSCTSFLG